MRLLGALLILVQLCGMADGLLSGRSRMPVHTGDSAAYAAALLGYWFPVLLGLALILLGGLRSRMRHKREKENLP